MKVLLAALILASSPAAVMATPIPDGFESAGADRTAIETLLATYTHAVSTKNRAEFETLLLNTGVPFSAAGQAVKTGETRDYAGFRKGVFEGAPFTQRLQDVHILQDGPLAEVSLVFVNSSAQGSSWGWKTMQLLKVDGRWKIASEFFTGHPLG